MYVCGQTKYLRVYGSPLYKPYTNCTLGQPKFFLENWDKLHGRRLAKSWLDTDFQPPRTSFDHASEAPKVPR